MVYRHWQQLGPVRASQIRSNAGKHTDNRGSNGPLDHSLLPNLPENSSWGFSPKRTQDAISIGVGDSGATGSSTSTISNPPLTSRTSSPAREQTRTS